jgi:hypothetical protein
MVYPGFGRNGRMTDRTKPDGSGWQGAERRGMFNEEAGQATEKRDKPMRRSFMAVLVLVVLAGLLLTAGVYAQAPGANAAPSQPQGKAKVIFYYGKPVPLKDCLVQVGILIDGANAHQIGQWHVWQTELAPGTHTFMDDTHKDSKGETGTFVAGQTYYYEMVARVKPGFLPSCGRFYTKFEEMKSNSRDMQKAVAEIGKPGVDETTVTAAAAAPAAPAAPTTVKLAIVSTPDAADIEVDGSFMGNTPSAIELAPGEHSIIVTKKGYTPYQRKIKLAAGDIKINAELEADTPKQ